MIRHVTCKTYPVQRAKGHSAVAGAAYRSGDKLRDERSGRVADFSRRGPDVRETLILVPEGAPDWCSDRERLWNEAEAAERRKDARPAREVQLGLAVELTPDRQRALVVDFATREFVEKGFVVDVAFHDYGQRVTDASDTGRDAIRRWAGHGFPFLEETECRGLYEPHVKIERDGSGNVQGYKVYQPHAHLYVTGRPIEDDGFARKKPREFNSFEAAKEWRYEWPKLQNRYLEEDGFDVRVSSTSEDEIPDTRFRQLRESQSHETYSMELRGADASRESPETEVSDEASVTAVLVEGTEPPASSGRYERLEDEALEFNRMHNEAVRHAFRDQAREQDPDVRRERDEQRLTAWWKSMSARLDGWSDRFREQADVWRERVQQQAVRLRSWLAARRQTEEPESADAQAVERPSEPQSRIEPRDAWHEPPTRAGPQQEPDR